MPPSNSQPSPFASSRSSCSSRNSDWSSPSSMTTPSRAGTSGVSGKLTTLRPELQRDIEKKSYEKVSVTDFITYVWGADPSHMATILAPENEWTLLASAASQYTEVIDRKRNENKLYQPFMEMANHLTSHVRGRLHLDDSPIRFWAKTGDTSIKNEWGDSRKPDMLSLWNTAPFSEIPAWSEVQTFIEFKKKFEESPMIFPTLATSVASSISNQLASVPENRALADDLSTGPNLATQRGTDTVLISSSPTTTLSTGVLPKGTASTKAKPAKEERISRHLYHSCSQHDVTTGVPCTPSASVRSDLPTGTVISPKRRMPVELNERPKKKSRTKSSTPSSEAKTDIRSQVQLATYALSCMGATSRFYATGMLIDTYSIELWYFDRSSIITSKRFNFMRDVETFALVLYALSHCDLRHSGFDPCLRTTTVLSVPPVALGDGGPTVPIVDIEGFPDYKFQVHGPKKLYTYKGLIGRGTHVYTVTGLLPGYDDPVKDLVLKIGWPASYRAKEGDIIRKMRQEIPELASYLPEVVYSHTDEATSLQLPTTQMKRLKMPPDSTIEERHLHILAMKHCKKLWEVDDIAEFKKVFLDLIECHHFAYERGKVLHRDLSENNLMFRYHESEQGELHAKGVLNDWDMASELTKEGEVSITTARHRTGTLPFMAIELLSEEPPIHLYRHDLESFLYILIWAAIHYNLTAKKRLDKVNVRFERWTSGALAAVRDAKTNFLMHPTAIRDVLDLVQTDFNELKDAWIKPLFLLFRGALASPPIFDVQEHDEWYPTCNGRLTFETLMKALGHEPRTFEEMAST